MFQNTNIWCSKCDFTIATFIQRLIIIQEVQAIIWFLCACIFCVYLQGYPGTRCMPTLPQASSLLLVSTGQTSHKFSGTYSVLYHQVSNSRDQVPTWWLVSEHTQILVRFNHLVSKFRWIHFKYLLSDGGSQQKAGSCLIGKKKRLVI